MWSHLFTFEQLVQDFRKFSESLFTLVHIENFFDNLSSTDTLNPKSRQVPEIWQLMKMLPFVNISSQ